MGGDREFNYHFNQVVADAPPPVLAQIGEALLAVEAQRGGRDVDAPAALRQAYLALAQHVISVHGANMTPQQQLFLLSGALADAVIVKNPKGERLRVDLLDSEVYEGLLGGLEHGGSHGVLCTHVLCPRRRVGALARGELAPLDLAHPGRYRPPGERGGAVDAERLRAGFAEARKQLEDSRKTLKQALKILAEQVRSERLGPLLKAVGEVRQLADLALGKSATAAELAELPLPEKIADSPAVQMLSEVSRELRHALEQLSVANEQVLGDAFQLKRAARAVVLAEVDPEAAPAGPPVVLAQHLKLVEQDIVSFHNVVVQSMLNSPQRTPWSASRILLREHTEKAADPLSECYATPANVARSIEKLEALHPNCFPHDEVGQPQLPPIVVEPGVGLVRWLDDRFLLSFVCTDPPRRGGNLSLTPVDLAVARLYGLFLARGDIFNYRGERISGSFMADYAGEIEQKAVAKYTGEKKKLTYTTASEERDSATRDDAVRDYVDFLFHVSNELPLPKRINPRRVSVILHYCLIGDEERTADLVLKHIAPHDALLARELVGKLSSREAARVVALFRSALEGDAQLASRYRNSLERALADVMGKEFVKEAQAANLLGAAVTTVEEVEQPPSEAPASGHDYFDV
jgi:hypothetical protein